MLPTHRGKCSRTADIYRYVVKLLFWAQSAKTASNKQTKSLCIETTLVSLSHRLCLFLLNVEVSLNVGAFSAGWELLILSNYLGHTDGCLDKGRQRPSPWQHFPRHTICVSPAKDNCCLIQSITPKQSEVQKTCSIVFIPALWWIITWIKTK